MENMVNERPEVTFWGCRGSVAYSNQEKQRYSNNTPCVSIRFKDQFFVFDAGTGIVNFSRYFDANQDASREIHLFLSHFHYDHIEGLPYSSLINQENFLLYGPRVEEKTLHTFLEETFSPPHYPKDVFKLHPEKTFTLDSTGSIDFGHVEVTYMTVNHPGSSTSYKWSYKDISFCYLTDYEWEKSSEATVKDFIHGVDLLVIDGYFTEKDYQHGWGHSTIEKGMKLARKSFVKQCAFFHYNPHYSDNYLDALDFWVKEKNTSFFFAKENMRIVL